MKKYIAALFLIFSGIVFLNAYRPVHNFITPPDPWPGKDIVTSKLPVYDTGKKTVFIIADAKLTEMFDMLAPFYLFNATEKANVYIVAKDKTPILIKKELFVNPQLTFGEADSLQLPADVIVIPALSKRDEHQDASVISWITKHFTATTKLITICDGASTGAATGLYDGKPITAHASDFEDIKPHFTKPVWVQNVTVAQSGNLFSTAGVSNAVEGSLLVIEELFGTETAQKVASGIHYPHAATRLAHQSIALNGWNKFDAVKKVLFGKNRNIGILLADGINEFAMAAILDTYSRTFPASFRTYILHDSTVDTKYGLKLIYTGKNETEGLKELHLLTPGSLTSEGALLFKDAKMVRYDPTQQEYLFNICFKRIEEQYGHAFKEFVKISLDYN